MFIISLVLAGCSLNQDAASLYKTETPLEAEIKIPESFQANKQEEIKIILTQDGERVQNADFVHMEIEKQDGSVSYHMEETEKKRNGVYIIKKDFKSDGLYYAKLHAGNDGSTIMPQKLFIVGELSSNELEFLQENLQKQQDNQEAHH